MKETRLRVLNNQIRRLDRRLEGLDRISDRYSWLRMAVVLLALAATGLAYYFLGPWPAAAAAALGLLAFGATVYGHRRVERAIARHRLWRWNKEVQIARATLDWDRIPAGVTFRPRPEHPFEADLDLVGPRSLHLLLDTAATYEGSQRLRDWLADPAPELDQVQRRQHLVRELAPMHTFRDRLVLNAYGGRRDVLTTGSRHTWKVRPLADWLAAQSTGLEGIRLAGGGGAHRDAPPQDASLRRWLLLLSGLVALNVLLLAGRGYSAWAAGQGYSAWAGGQGDSAWPPLWQLTTVLYLGLWWYRTRATAAAWNEALSLRAALGRLGAVFQQLEGFGYEGKPHLRALCAPFLDPRHRPSRYLSLLTRLVTGMSLRQNPLLGLLLNLVLPWDAYLTYRLGQTRAAMSDRAGAWLEAWVELEALSSLATFAYLNPGYAFPEIRAGGDQAVFHARGLGHPLIPDDQKVCNDFAIPHLGWVAIITGSNMAGKSVFLKTVGANLALAYAGGPVSARALQTRLFRLFASMEVSDSVTDGISYFYAEVKRLKALLAALEATDPSLRLQPLLFFIDEIFRGTNNRERLLGSRAYVQALVGKHGAGLIATHDLELARLGAEGTRLGAEGTRLGAEGTRLGAESTGLEGTRLGAERTTADEYPAAVVNYHFRDQVVEGRTTGQLVGQLAGQLAFDYVLRPGPCPTTNALKIMALEGLPVPGEPDE